MLRAWQCFHKYRIIVWIVTTVITAQSSTKVRSFRRLCKRSFEGENQPSSQPYFWTSAYSKMCIFVKLHPQEVLATKINNGICNVQNLTVLECDSETNVTVSQWTKSTSECRADIVIYVVKFSKPNWLQTMRNGHCTCILLHSMLTCHSYQHWLF